VKNKINFHVMLDRRQEKNQNQNQKLMKHFFLRPTLWATFVLLFCLMPKGKGIAQPPSYFGHIPIIGSSDNVVYGIRDAGAGICLIQKTGPPIFSIIENGVYIWNGNLVSGVYSLTSVIDRRFIFWGLFGSGETTTRLIFCGLDGSYQGEIDFTTDVAAWIGGIVAVYDFLHVGDTLFAYGAPGIVGDTDFSGSGNAVIASTDGGFNWQAIGTDHPRGFTTKACVAEGYIYSHYFFPSLAEHFLTRVSLDDLDAEWEDVDDVPPNAGILSMSGAEGDDGSPLLMTYIPEDPPIFGGDGSVLAVSDGTSFTNLVKADVSMIIAHSQSVQVGERREIHLLLNGSFSYVENLTNGSAIETNGAFVRLVLDSETLEILQLESFGGIEFSDGSPGEIKDVIAYVHQDLATDEILIEYLVGGDFDFIELNGLKIARPNLAILFSTVREAVGFETPNTISDSEIGLYPNPVTSLVTITGLSTLRANESFHVEIVGLDGRTVKVSTSMQVLSGYTTSTLQLDVADIPEGMYYVVVDIVGKSSTNALPTSFFGRFVLSSSL